MKRAIAIASLTLLAACGHETPPPAAVAPKIEGERVIFAAGSPQLGRLKSEPIDMARHNRIKVPGRLAWDEAQTVRVFSPLAGRIQRLLAEPGKPVAAGGPLARIASPDFGQAQAEARGAQAAYAVADKALVRARELHEQGVVAAKDLQSAEADFVRAAAERDRTAARARLWGDGAVIDGYELRAPIGGLVVERNANPGQEVRPDQNAPGSPALFVISDPTRLWVQLDLPESAIARVVPGTSFKLLAPSLDGEPPVGRIDFVADALDPVSRTTRARGSVANPERRLKAEMFVQAEIEVAGRDMVHVPATAVILLGKSQHVFLDEGNGRFVRRRITAREGDGGVMDVADGLAAGERVVVDGALLLQQFLAGK